MKQPLSLARQKALAKAQQGGRDAAAARWAALSVPAPFRNARDFLATVHAVARALPEGANRQIAAACGVHSSTVSKWFLGKKYPSQPALDKIAAWWKTHREIIPEQAPTTPRETRAVSLARLPDQISARLKRAAKLRNLKPIEYAAQILDRHLPRIEEME